MISLYHKPLMITLVEFTVTTQEIWMLSMLSLLLDTVLKMAISTGLSETHGEPSGVRKDSSASAEEPTTLQLKVVAIGPHLLTPGLKRKLIKLLMMRRTMIEMTRPSTHSHNQPMTESLAKT